MAYQHNNYSNHFTDTEKLWNCISWWFHVVYRQFAANFSSYSNIQLNWTHFRIAQLFLVERLTLDRFVYRQRFFCCCYWLLSIQIADFARISIVWALVSSHSRLSIHNAELYSVSMFSYLLPINSYKIQHARIQTYQ